MMSRLPIPDGTGIYTYPDDLVAAHRRWMRQVSLTDGPGPAIELTAPHGGARYPIMRRRPCGRPVIVLEPHHDDLVLSASGMFLSRPRPLAVVTVFSRSACVHSSLQMQYPDVPAVSTLRAAEAREALRPLAASSHLLGYKDAESPYAPYAPDRAERLADELETIVAGRGDVELLAPAAVTRHPDHLLVHHAARLLGCRWFFEDVAFWNTYALSADDQHLFHVRVGSALSVELVDITDVALDKLTLLHMHASQMQPVRSMYRPLRYAWTTGSRLGHRRYAERFYRLEAPS